jgi:hypothetical protein
MSEVSATIKDEIEGLLPSSASAFILGTCGMVIPISAVILRGAAVDRSQPVR